MQTLVIQRTARRYATIRRYGFLVFLLVPTLPVQAYLAATWFNAWGAAVMWTALIVFLIVPIADYLIGKDTTNPPQDIADALENDRWYAWMPVAALPICALLLAWGGAVFAALPDNLWVQTGWIVSIGIVMGVTGIVAAHELVHKRSRFEQNVGGLLLTLVCYGGFKVEHVRGHHFTVSTPEDQSSSRFNQSVYHFLLRAYYGNFMSAWRLEAKRLQVRGFGAFSFRNEVLRLSAISACICAVFGATLGWMGVVYFLCQSFVAVTLLEIVNYIEHYGLHRRKLPDGRWERVTPLHSWNSPFLLTNLFIFHLQRHSDHHAVAWRRYQSLKHYDESPQLPAGYGVMILLALVPPLWFSVMNPRVEAYYRDSPEALRA